MRQYLPEETSLTTNRWQIANNQSEKARATLVKYHANGNETSPLVDFEMSEITESIELE
jgi:hypothetical protein